MKLVIILGLVAAAQAVSLIDVSKVEWTNFKIKHGKIYKDANEEQLRFKIYLENRHNIAKHNTRYHQKDVSYSLGLNEFSDMLHSEFVQTHNGFAVSRGNESNADFTVEDAVAFIGAANVEIPESVDWRQNGAVTPVKNQAQCGSCWAFSATGSLEAQHFRKTGQLVSLSEQNLVDCSRANSGCNGGNVNVAFQYIRDNGGIDTESAYPYEAIDNSCRFSKESIGATVKGFVGIEYGNEEDLKHAVATVGPISIAIDASLVSFQHYSSGVYYDEQCDSRNLNHGVLIVGYGTDSKTNQNYWLVKNSWGTGWGDQGYVKMARNKGNACGIVSLASFPLV